MTEESASLIEFLRQMRAELATKADLASLGSEVWVTKSDMDTRRSELKSDLGLLRAALAADFLETRKDLNEQIDGLRRTVVDYRAMALRFCPSLRRFGASVAAPTRGKIDS
jgi:hypothetical protein